MPILINLVVSALNLTVYFHSNNQVSLFFGGFSFGIACLFALLIWDGI